MNAHILVAVLIAAAAELTGVAHAQTFPSKAVRIVVPFPPGGAADITSRVLAEHMAKGLGQSVLVENRPGGSTIIGAEVVASSPADGHTLLVVFPSFIINPALRHAMSFDPLKDFKAVAQTTSVPMAIAVNPSVPAQSLQELIALARTRPGEISYGTPGTGTTHHVMGEMLKLAAKINIVHAPFQGLAPALTAATGGHIQMVYGNVAEIAPSVKSGRMRAIVVTTAERADVLPDVPTMREARIPGAGGDELERHGRPERDSAVCDRPPQCRTGRRSAQRRHTGKAQELWNVSCTEHTGPVRCFFKVRGGEVRKSRA